MISHNGTFKMAEFNFSLSRADTAEIFSNKTTKDDVVQAKWCSVGNKNSSKPNKKSLYPFCNKLFQHQAGGNF